MKIITVASLKGGVGKTTLSLFLSQSLTGLGKVLLVDLDPNNNATDYLLPDVSLSELEKANAFHVLTKKIPLKDCVQHGLFLDVLPATMSLMKAIYEMNQNPALQLGFRKELEKANYDFVVIDTPPSLDPLFRVGLYTADLVLTPIAPSRWVFQAVSLLRNELEKMSETIDRQPELLAVQSMITEKESESMFSEMKEFVNMAKTSIIKQAVLKNAIESRKTIKPESRQAEIFYNLAKEVS